MEPRLTAAPGAAALEDGPVTRAGWRIVLLASLGGALEFYDFVVFGVFAGEIGATIFPNPSPIVSLIVSFGVFAVGYLARPVGGIVLGHYGDRYGRRRVFLLSLFVMSAATFGMGLVPSHQSWGAASAILFITLRLVQGLCLGGELPGALTYVVETAPRQAPFACGVVFSCVTMGVALATGVSVSLRTWLPGADMLAYGWRLAFLLGGAGGFLSFLLRRSLEESPEFSRMKALASKRPFREVFAAHPAAVGLGIATLGATACFNGLFFAHMPAYLAGVLSYDPRRAVVAQTAGVVVHAAAILGVGALANRVRPALLLRAGALLLMTLAYPFYRALAAHSVNLTLLLVCAGLAASLVNGTFAYLLTGLFPTRVRFTGVALVFNVAFTLFSGTAPLVATTLIGATGLASAPALALIPCALLTALASLRLASSGGTVTAPLESGRC